MKNHSYRKIIGVVAALATPLALFAQTTVFSDNFTSGNDTLNGTSTPGGTVVGSQSYTSWDIASTKTSTSSLASGKLNMGLSAATTSGFYEAQAVFSSSAVTLATINDYVNLTFTFTDTANILAGGSASGLFFGLYDDASTTPVAGSLANSGLTSSANAYSSGNAANWSGYNGKFLGSGGTDQLYARPVQNGILVTNANQDLIGNHLGGGAYSNPQGAAGIAAGGSSASTLALTAGNQYTVSYTISLSAANTLTVGEAFFDSGGNLLSSLTNTFSSVSDLNFDGLAIGVRNSGTSLNPQIAINSLTVSDLIQSAPEPGTLALLGGGAALALVVRRRRQQ